MNGAAQLAALIAATASLMAASLELFWFDRHAVRRFLRVEADSVQDVRMWAFVVGFRNALAGAGTLIGLLILRTGHEPIGATVVVACCVYMLLASLAMGLADLLGYWRPPGGSVRGTVGSSALPLAALVLAAA
jgi:putative membrane protein